MLHGLVIGTVIKLFNFPTLPDHFFPSPAPPPHLFLRARDFPSFTLKEFAEGRLGPRAWVVGGEGGLGASLRVLDEHGYLQRITRDMQDLTVRVLAPRTGAAAASPVPRGRQKLVLEALQGRAQGRGAAGSGAGGRTESAAAAAAPPSAAALTVSPSALCAELGVERAQLLAALRGLEAKGLVEYSAPEASGGVRLLRSPREGLALGAEAEAEVERRQEVELEKLHRMVAYASSPCRRRYLVEHFGERAPPFGKFCGTCDKCRVRLKRLRERRQAEEEGKDEGSSSRVPRQQQPRK